MSKVLDKRIGMLRLFSELELSIVYDLLLEEIGKEQGFQKDVEYDGNYEHYFNVCKLEREFRADGYYDIKLEDNIDTDYSDCVGVKISGSHVIPNQENLRWEYTIELSELFEVIDTDTTYYFYLTENMYFVIDTRTADEMIRTWQENWTELCPRSI